jgi:hypothetical protein
LASEFCIARISCASVVVVARDCSVLASKFLVARIKSTNIAVVTVNCNVLASLLFIASISRASVGVIANYRRVDATSCCVTVVDGTCIEVIAINWNVADNSSDNATLFSCAFVVVAKLFWGENASFGLVASIISARISITASFCGVDASFDSITFFSGTCINIRADNRSVLATKSWAASIFGAYISIATVYFFREIANSIFAFVDCAEIVINAF